MIDGGGDIELTLKIENKLLSKWTGMTNGEIKRAFDSITFSTTYNLLASLPRRIVLTQKEVITEFMPHKKVDSFNVCNNLLNNTHPIDK